MATDSKTYDFSQIEPHWQGFWQREKTFRARNFTKQPTFYVLDMFPYPSGAGLHIGHPEGYTASDILGRYKLARGYNVLHPMGWDAFGLPAEQHAIATGTPPAQNTAQNIENFRGQIERLGFALDWEREVNTTDPKYFKWTQWIFLQLFKHGLAYVDDKPVWYCPALGTVLANEEVLNTDEGPRSERGNHPVERRPLRQWVLRITKYADKLLKGLADVDWPDSTKRMQTEWIGKSTGAEVVFELDGQEGKSLTVFTTRPDTLYGATYMVVAPEHPLLKTITTDEQRNAVNAYVEKAAQKSDLERTDLAKEKSGVFTGGYAINPVNGEKLPIWVADYVLISYGTGAIMAVPAHDERDYEFAKQYDIPIIEVVQPPANVELKEGECFSGQGTMVNSGEYDGMPSADFKKKITDKLESEQRGKAAVNFKLRDWLFSRQRYWGEPFPIVWVNEDAYKNISNFEYPLAIHEFMPEEPVCFEKDDETLYAIPLPSKHLPLELPQVESYQPTGTGESPLAKATEWVDVWLDVTSGQTRPASEPCPGETWIRGTRESNTMPQWAGSCWYYLRYLDPHNDKQLVDPEIEKYWGMPDFYIGGAEHAVLHLLYARFWHQFLHDIGVLSAPEPFKKLFHQGIILGEDGQKMSKSRGNVVNPDVIIKEYGADALRLFEMFLGPLEAMKPWNTGGMEGIARFLRKIWRELIDEQTGGLSAKIAKGHEDDKATLRLLHETIKKVTEDIEALGFNTAISQMMILVNHLAKQEKYSHETASVLVQLVAPFAPHMGEELWERLGHKPSVVHAKWPEFDASKLVQDEVKIVFQVNGKVRGDALVSKDISKDEVLSMAKANERVAAQLEGKSIVKEIYVPGKIVNLVAK